jgi:AraC family transcriptional regulator
VSYAPDPSSAVSTRVGDPRLEQIRFASEIAAVGALRCPRDSRYFRGEQVTDNYVVAFPRAALWIRQDRDHAFVATSTLATIYNRGQRFVRQPIAAEGDTADWFALAEEIVREAVAEWDPAASESRTPLRHSRTPISPALYGAQRAIFEGADRRDPAAVEEQVVGIFRSVVRAAYRPTREMVANADTGTARRARRDLVEQAKALLAATYTESLGLADLARRCDVSVYHLCRTFRAATGHTLHGYRRDLRLRAALEPLLSCRGRLSDLALRLGFSSHSHFTAAFRQHYGMHPQRWQQSMDRAIG